MKRNFGQALVEITLAISLLGLLLLVSMPQVEQSLAKRWRGQQLLPVVLADHPLRATAGLESRELEDYEKEFRLPVGDDYELDYRTTSDYAFANLIAPVWDILSTQRGFSLPTNNLAVVQLQHEESEQPWLTFSRLSNAWQPQSLAHLSSRPKALTTTEFLNQLGFQEIQSLLGLIPFAREFSPDQLRVGHVDVDVVPAHARCQNANCN
ncbi:hypothetical protein [Aliidiomarina haloalkalitolerans]|uniref:Uncharacterized protein n=1 Tax=Aliidiomarina haloalkalitolerans TaxID=859059 RepID=A0A432VZ86_9GAMM|nr:hypothetical protein [Aliidiomarina haloalkalitolerans]RUO21963.1 hypothetical protein CWE06_03730 [Aliidiomarina haloalkalitolerans]